MNETQSHLDEIQIICAYCSKNRIPYVLSLFFDESLKLLSGEKVRDVLPFIREHGPLAIGFNCIMPGTFRKMLQEGTGDYNSGFYLNCGDGGYKDKDIKCGIYPEEYSSYVKEFLTLHPAFVGACCGSSPGHIHKIKELFELRDGN